MKKRRKLKILEYTCRRCGERHPFNRYCPYTIEPPIVPGECRSCTTLTNHHDKECELVAIKDQIGLCAFCGDISHLYADCQDRYPNRGPKRILPPQGRSGLPYQSYNWEGPISATPILWCLLFLWISRAWTRTLSQAERGHERAGRTNSPYTDGQIRRSEESGTAT